MRPGPHGSGLRSSLASCHPPQRCYNSRTRPRRRPADDRRTRQPWPRLTLDDDRYFGPDPRQREIARALYEKVAGLPLVCPHGHVDPRMFADPDYSLRQPGRAADHPRPLRLPHALLPGHPAGEPGRAAPRRRPGGDRPAAASGRPLPTTSTSSAARPPASGWPTSCSSVFGVEYKLNGESAQYIYDQIAELPGAARVPPAPPLRAFQHRGADHHRRRLRHAGPPPGHPRLGLGGPRAAHLPARRRGEPGRARLAAEPGCPGRRLRLRDRQLPRPGASPGGAPRLLQVHGRHGHRPQRPDRPHRGADRPPRPRPSSSAPCAARPRPTTPRASPATC